MKNGGEESKQKGCLGKGKIFSSTMCRRGTYKLAVLSECWPERNRVIDMKAETDVGKSRWPAKWKMMFYTDADTNRVNKNHLKRPRHSSLYPPGTKQWEKYTPSRGDFLRLSSEVWHMEFYFDFKQCSASFAKHYGTDILTDCKCFCGKVFHGSHQPDWAGLLLLQENVESGSG